MWNDTFWAENYWAENYWGTEAVILTVLTGTVSTGVKKCPRFIITKTHIN